MTEPRRADLFTVGEQFAPSDFVVTEEFNENYLHAVEDMHPRYMEGRDGLGPVVHPGLLINSSNVTRSPSFHLPPGMAAVHTHEEVRYLTPGRVGKRFRVTWKVVATYERRGRPYQVVDTLITDEDGAQILRRTTTNTYVGGPYAGAS